MNPDLVFLVEMGLVFGAVIAFAVYELVKLHREDGEETDED